MTELTLPTSATRIDPLAPRNASQAILRGARLRCPSCDEGHLFKAYLKVADSCPKCGEDLHHHRADDAPAYFTITIVGHIVVAGALLLEKGFAPETWVHMVLWVPLTLILCLGLLPVVKGALVGLQWAYRMHGFGGVEDQPEPEPLPASEAAAPRGRP